MAESTMGKFHSFLFRMFLASFFTLFSCRGQVPLHEFSHFCLFIIKLRDKIPARTCDFPHFALGKF